MEELTAVATSDSGRVRFKCEQQFATVPFVLTADVYRNFYSNKDEQTEPERLFVLTHVHSISGSAAASMLVLYSRPAFTFSTFLLS